MSAPTARPGTFLVVDDSALHHQMYRLIFSKGSLAGSTVHHAMNGREGYALLAAHPEDYLRKPFQPADLERLVARLQAEHAPAA